MLSRCTGCLAPSYGGVPPTSPPAFVCVMCACLCVGWVGLRGASRCCLCGGSRMCPFCCGKVLMTDTHQAGITIKCSHDCDFQSISPLPSAGLRAISPLWSPPSRLECCCANRFVCKTALFLFLEHQKLDAYLTSVRQMKCHRQSFGINDQVQCKGDV